LELNSLSVGRFTPDDLLGLKGKLRVFDPFNGCYLFTNENENGLTVDVDKQIPVIVADFLYQKIVATRDVAWPTLGRMENAENGDGTPERAPGSNNPERSKRFLTFGIKRLAVPEQEIREYLTYNFARQASLQLRYNSWSDTSGFVDEPRNQDFHEFVAQKEIQLRWAISDEHLTLSAGILPEDVSNKKWKPINNEWQDVLPNFKSLVREKAPESWLDELSKLCEKRFDQDYRGLGVRNFYKSKLKTKKEHVREIRKHVEGDLFFEWKNGVKSAQDISHLMAALLESLDERRKLMDDKIAQMKDNEEGAANRIRSNNEIWAHLGFLDKKVLGKRDSLLDAQGDALLEHYIYRTRIEALTFAKELTEELVAELSDLKGEIDQCAAMIAAAVKKYNDRIAERVTDDGKADLREQLVRFYDPDLVRRVCGSLIKDENEQRVQTNRVRQALIAKLGEHPNFSLFNERIGVNEFIDILDKESASNAQIAHNNLVVNAKEKLLGVSIIERLRERYGGDQQDLRSYVTELVSRAGNYLTFDPGEVGKIGPGIPTGVQTKIAKMSIIMPKAPEQADFTTKLKEVFKGATRGDLELIDSDAKPNEITLISLTNLFPLRYVKQVAFLKERYDLKMKANGDRAKLELHLEGDGSQHPRIFVPLQDEVKRDAIPYLLLAKAAKLLQEGTRPGNGATGMWFVAKDEDGFDTDPIDLGKDLPEAATKVDVENADFIRRQVTKILETQFALDSQRGELLKSVVSKLRHDGLGLFHGRGLGRHRSRVGVARRRLVLWSAT
jgi:Tubulin like